MSEDAELTWDPAVSRQWDRGWVDADGVHRLAPDPEPGTAPYMRWDADGVGHGTADAGPLPHRRWIPPSDEWLRRSLTDAREAECTEHELWCGQCESYHSDPRPQIAALEAQLAERDATIARVRACLPRIERRAAELCSRNGVGDVIEAEGLSIARDIVAAALEAHEPGGKTHDAKG